MTSPRLRGATVAVLAVLLAALVPVPAAGGSDGYALTGLHEVGGGIWRSENRFVVRWDANPAVSSSIVHYAVRGPNHEVLAGATEGEDPERWDGATVSVPSTPGTYLFEAWNVEEGRHDQRSGPAVSVPLHFDDARPGAVSIAAPAWVAAGASIPIRLSHPAAPLPVSGIHGYAVEIDGAVDGAPCAHAERCATAEVDLPGGIEDDSIALAAPPEGISYLHAVAVSGSGVSSPGSTLAIGVDGTAPQVRLEGAPADWADGPVRLTAVATDPLSGMAADGAGGPVTAIGVDGAAPLLTPGAASSTTVTGQGTHRIAYWGRDAVGNAGDGSSPFAQPSTATIRIDETDPSVRFAAPDPSDPERLEALVADPLSGPDPGRGSIALRPAGGSGRFQPLPTDAGRGRLIARWDSDDYPRGAYEFRATGFDAAGNSATNPAADPLVLRNPVKRVARLAFGFGGEALVYQRCSRAHGARRCHRTVVRSFARRPTTRSIPCCHGAAVGGRLLDAAGAPLAGQTVDVVETFAGGARRRSRTTVVTTDGDGYFRARLAPGPSRRVTAEFPGTRRLTRAAGGSLRLRVRAAVRMKVSTAKVRVGGAPVVFSGRIVHPEARIPVRGLPVELEFRLPGIPWTEFRTVQSDANGRFAYPYSFSDDDSAGVRFLFRAFVPATGGWPFAPATSRPLAVTG
ncbi:MAG: carboxypeptidase regulatory-like domain-containing protein [Solirubrobacterales bacterium]